MSLLFFGSSSFSVPALVALHSSVSCVVTKKTKPKGRGYLLEDNEVKRTDPLSRSSGQRDRVIQG